MKIKHLGLFGRLFTLFGFTTIMLALCVALGAVTMSKQDAKAFVDEQHDSLKSMLIDIIKDPIDHDHLVKSAKQNRVEILVESGPERWSTKATYPTIDTLLQRGERVGDLVFVHHNFKYYLVAEYANKYIAVTSNLANLIIYPRWLVYWPWLVGGMILMTSYVSLKRTLQPISDAIESAKLISQGKLNYRIKKHANNELSQLTKGLNYMASELKDRFDAKNDLLMSISHEIRTPLARMSISLAMLEANRNTEDLRKDLYLLDTLVEQLLEGERLEKGNDVLSLSTFFLPTLIDDVISEKGLSGHVSKISALPELAVNVDVGRIKFVIRNLLKNAVKYSQSEYIQLSVNINTNALSIEVFDDGPGVPEQLLEKVFEPFYQVQEVKNRSVNGTGLGLFLCRRIARAHGGDIKVNNRQPKGCQFIFELPTTCIICDDD